jgi:IS605 OrfB family transposase
MEKYLDGSWTFGLAKVVNKHGKWYLHISMSKEFEQLQDYDVANVVGVDLGINFTATAYDSNSKTTFYSGKHIKQNRGHYKNIRKQLQKRQTSSARHRLKAIGSRENRWINDVNHCISKALVETNPKGTAFILEDLAGIRNATEKVRIKDRYISVSWAFYDLRQKLEYKTKMTGNKVIIVEPKYTSQTCPKCGHTEYGYHEKEQRYQCKKRHCYHQTTLTAGTVMDHTRLPIKIWFWAIFLMATDKRGSSATYISKMLGIRYKSAWLLLHKLRSAMGKRDAKYLLDSIVELDDTYFGGTKPGGKRGRGTSKIKVLAALSKDKDGKPKRLKMSVVPNLKGKTVSDFAKDAIAVNCVVETDAYRSYRKPLSEKFSHNWQVFDADAGTLAWLHTIISNAKSFVQGTFHGLGRLHLQRYLDEFCWRFNRRHRRGSLFFDLLRTAVSAPKATYADLKG